MRTLPAVAAALLLVTLAAGTARADDSRPGTPAQAPDAGFLEFLGGVDQLADVNPDYLKQAGAARPGSAPPKPPANPAPPPPAPVPQANSHE